MGQEAAGQLVEVVEAHRRQAEAEDIGRAQDDEEDDGRHLDEGEPVLDGPEIADRAGVHIEQDAGEPDRPHPDRRAGEPIGHVDARRDRLAADRDHLGEPVGITDDKAGPGVQVSLGIGAERSRRRVHHRHLGQTEHHHHGDEPGDGVADQHRGPGIADG